MNEIMGSEHETMKELLNDLPASSPESDSQGPGNVTMDILALAFRPKLRPPSEPQSPIREEQAPNLQRNSVSSSSSSTARTKGKLPIWVEQGFATYSAYHKFEVGLHRIHTLSIRYKTSAPEICHHLQILKRCFGDLPLPLDNLRAEAEVEGEEQHGDVDINAEKTRKWKFRFLDLIIEMLLDEREMSGKEVANMLLYAEVAAERFRKKLEGKGKGNGKRKAVEYDG
jgi:hypothetical protein